MEVTLPEMKKISTEAGFTGKIPFSILLEMSAELSQQPMRMAKVMIPTLKTVDV